MITFHRATVDDADLLVYLWWETFIQAYKTVHTPENLSAYCEQHYTINAAQDLLTNPQIMTHLAYRENNPVAFSTVNYHPCPIEIAGTSAELKQIYTLATEYGSGLGFALFEQAAHLLQNAGYDLVWLAVSKRNFRAQRFYEKLNFNPVGDGPTFNVGTDRLPSTILIRPLKGQ